MPQLMFHRQQSTISCSWRRRGDPPFVVLQRGPLEAGNPSVQLLFSMATNGTGASYIYLVLADYHRSNIRVKSDEEDWFALVIALLHVSEPSAHGTCTVYDCYGTELSFFWLLQFVPTAYCT